MNRVTTTQRIKELSIQKYGRILANVDDDCIEFLNLCCQNASRMAELLDRAHWLLTTPVERETVDEWQKEKFSWLVDFEFFQRGE